MTDFIIKKLPYDLTSNAGLALVGQYTKRLEISASVDRKFHYVFYSKRLVLSTQIRRTFAEFP